MQSFAHEIDWLKSRVSQDPASMFYARLADKYLQNNDVDQAIEHAEKAALMHPHDVTARFVLAKCNYVKQDFEKADKNLNDVLALDPQHFGALDLQADLFRGQGATDRVKENFDQLIDLDPLNETVHLKNVAFPEPARPSAKESFQDDWDAALLPEDERPTPQSDSELDSVSEFELDAEPKVESSEFELDSQWEPEKVEDSFDTEQPVESMRNESLFDEPLQDDALPDDSFRDDPFADFEETTPLDDNGTPVVDEAPAFNDDISAVEEEPFSFDQADEQPTVEEEYRSEDVLDESVDDDFEIDKSKFREEKSKFTRFLDDIFSSSLSEEEQRENEQRTTIERIADTEPHIDEPVENSVPSKADDDFEPLMSPEEIVFPEEKILESDRSHHDEFDDFNGADTHSDESKNSGSEDFSSFLDSLDIQDGSKTEHELPKEFDDPLPKLDDDFAMSEDLKNILEPLSQNDDWMQDLSDAVSEESSVSETADEHKVEPELEALSEPESESEQENAVPPIDNKSSNEDKGKFYTPTLGEIYAAQGQYAKAISVYENLLKSEPDNDMYQSKLELLRKKLAEQQ